MQTETKLPNGIINPFSDLFLDTWELWKKFRWEQHKFKYKGCVSEQVKLMQLTQLSDGNEQAAIAIIMQSIGEGWSGLYKLKTVKINGNGESKQAGSAASTRESLNDLYNKRFGSRKQTQP